MSSGVSTPLNLGVYNENVTALERAVKERVFFVRDGDGFREPPTPRGGAFASCLAGTRKQLSRFLPSAAPLTYAEFVSTFRGRKMRVYQAAADSLMAVSLTRKDANIRCFVKYEKINFSAKHNPAPRVISPRTPRYNTEVGRFLRPVENRIFKAIDRLFGQPTVMKGYNSSQCARIMRAKWDSFADPVAVGMDASRFDQHVSIQALEWEHDVYVSCFPRTAHRKKLASLLSMQLRNRCGAFLGDGSLHYVTEGGRMSGDMNTSLGNCLLMCSMIHAYLASVKVSAQLANNGDDCVVFMERSSLSLFSRGVAGFFLELGFNMVVEPFVSSFEEIEFCQTRPVMCDVIGPDYVMVRLPTVAVAKDCVALKPWTSRKEYLGWVQAVGDGGIALTGGIPVFQEFYSMLRRFGEKWSKIGEFESWGGLARSRGMSRVYGSVAPEVRASFYFAFGITPDEQMAIEDAYREAQFEFSFVDEHLYGPDLPY